MGLQHPIMTTERSFKQKINKQTMDLSETLDQMDLTVIFRTFQPKTSEYILFKCIWDTLQNRLP